MEKILIIDNFDSFTYNLKQLVQEAIGQKPDVFFYDQVNHVLLRRYDKIIISPGPGIPSDFPDLMTWIKDFAGKKAMLGICLGHQAIAKAFGGMVNQGKQIFHGIIKESEITDTREILFNGISGKFISGLYHSWKISESDFPESLKITSIAEDGIIMSITHRVYNIKGVQFHPESVMTPDGLLMMKNWLQNPA